MEDTKAMRLQFAQQNQKRECVLILGMFDGVHMGHRALIDKAKTLGLQSNLPVVVCTFDRHPMTVINYKNTPPMLMTLFEKASRFAQCEVDELVFLNFTKALQNISPEDFVLYMAKEFTPRHIAIGFNYSFGSGGRGTPELLSQMGRAHGFEVHIVPPVMIDGQIVSSTRIRQCLAQGQIEQAMGLLERPYSLSGNVIPGKQMARELGFPTANIKYNKNKAIPAFGTYIAIALVKNKHYKSVVNVGRHPTLPSGGITIEAHLLGFAQSIYGEKIKISFLHKLRDEVKFDNIQMLSAQIEKDIKQTEAYFDALLSENI